MNALLSRAVSFVGLGWFVVKAFLVAVAVFAVGWLLWWFAAAAAARAWRRWRDRRVVEQLRRGRAHYVRSPHVMPHRRRWAP